MKDIKAILDDNEVDSEKAEAIIKAVKENYRTINELESKNERINELQTQNEELITQVQSIEGTSEEIDQLKAKIKSFEDADEQRKKDEAEKAKRFSFEQLFNATITEKFSNDLVRETVFNKAYEMCNEGAGVGVKDAVEAITKDMNGVWVNPQNDVHNMPDPSEISTSKDTGEDMAKKEIKQFLFSR